MFYVKYFFIFKKKGYFFSLGLRITDETSDATVQNLNCLFPYINVSLLVFFFFVQSFKRFRSSLQSFFVGNPVNIFYIFCNSRVPVRILHAEVDQVVPIGK